MSASHKTGGLFVRNLRNQWRLVLGAALICIPMLLPFWVMLVTALMSSRSITTAQPPLLPQEWHWENFTRLFDTVPMGRYILNSLFVSGITTVVHVLFCAMAAFAFARLPMPRKNLIFFVFLITMMIPPQINIVPLFFLMKWFGWLNTYYALIVPGLFGAFGVFMLRQWFNTIPRDLEDAARLDGCSPWQIFWNVFLPLSTPALAALSIFVFITSWNSFMWPLISTYSESMRTLPVGLAALKAGFTDNTDWPLLMAASAISILPVLAVFLIGQKQFMRGLLSGSLKE